MSGLHSVPWLGVPILSFSRTVLTNIYLQPSAGVGKVLRLIAWSWGWEWGEGWEFNFTPDYQLILLSSGLHFL